MNEQLRKVAAHPATAPTGVAGGSLLAIVIVLFQMGVFDRGASEPDEHLMETALMKPRLARVETELDIGSPQSRLDRIEVIVGNLATISEERTNRESDVYGLLKELLEEEGP